MTDKRKQFAAHVGRTYFKTEPPFSLNGGGILSVALVAAAVVLVLFDHSAPAVLLASTPLAVVQQLEKDFGKFKDRHITRLDEHQRVIENHEKAIDRFRLHGPRVVDPGDGSLPGDPRVAKALRAYIGHGDGALLQELGAGYFAAQDMQVGTDPSGGYYVSPVIGSKVLQVLRERNPLRQISRIVEITSDEYKEPQNTDDPAASWVAETESRPATDAPTARLHSVPVHEIYAMPEITQKLVDDGAFDIESWVTEKVGQAFADAEGTTLVNGNGVGRPRGLLTYTAVTTDDDSRTWGELQYVPTGAAGAFATSDPGDALVDLVHKLKVPYHRDARFVMNRATAAEVRKLKDGQGNYLWQRAFVAGQPESLLGFPVTLSEDMPAITADSFSIAFGDFRRGYLVVDRKGITLLRDPYTNKPYIRLYFHKRVGGDVSDFHAIKLLKFSAS